MAQDDVEEKHEGAEATPNGPVTYHPSDEESLPAGVSQNTGFTPEEQKRIIRRIDKRLIITLSAVSCMSIVDRTNLGSAAIAGMNKELEIQIGYRYSTTALVFFAPYIFIQPPSTYLARKIGPQLYLSTLTMLWGFCMIGMGFVQNWTALAELRVLLGVFEAGVAPVGIYLISTWYTRYEQGRRFAWFYIIVITLASSSGILTYVLVQIKGLAGYAGWRWIFIMEGAMTCALATVTYWLLVGFPDEKRPAWKFLNKRETKFVLDRVDEDRGDAKLQPFDLKKFLAAGLDLKIWGFSLILFALTTVTYGLSFFLPLILNNSMGFSVAASQCLLAPLILFSGILSYLNGWLGDKYHIRAPLLFFNMVVCLIGLPIIVFHKTPEVRYFAVFLVSGGCNSSFPVLMAWQANNIRGQWKRAFLAGVLVAFGGIGGIVGCLVFRSQDAPDYRPGFYACIACCLFVIVLVGLLSVKFLRDNRKAERGELIIECGEDDAKQDFRYTH